MQQTVQSTGRRVPSPLWGEGQGEGKSPEGYLK
jgi:hypothetical protein